MVEKKHFVHSFAIGAIADVQSIEGEFLSILFLLGKPEI